MSLLTPRQIAEFVAVSEEQVEEWMDDDRIPYVRLPDGSALIPLGGFQCCMSDLFDLGAYLDDLERAFDEKLA